MPNSSSLSTYLDAAGFPCCHFLAKVQIRKRLICTLLTFDHEELGVFARLDGGVVLGHAGDGWGQNRNAETPDFILANIE
jgi:hypothetical protein